MKTILFLTTIIAITIYARPVVAEQIRVCFATSNNGIYIFLFDTNTGDLSTPKLVAEIENPVFIVIHPNKKYIYTTTTGIDDSKDGGIAALRINDDGTLTLINKQSSEGRNPCHINLDDKGKCLMVVNYGSGSIASYKINKDGSISKPITTHQHTGSGADPSRQKEPHPHSIFPNPANTFAYVPDLGLDKVMIYKLDPKKAELIEAGSANMPGDEMGPRHLKWSKDGKYTYVINELTSKMTVFESTGRSGKLNHKDTLFTLSDKMNMEDMYGSEVRIHPNEKFGLFLKMSG